MCEKNTQKSLQDALVSGSQDSHPFLAVSETYSELTSGYQSPHSESVPELLHSCKKQLCAWCSFLHTAYILAGK